MKKKVYQGKKEYTLVGEEILKNIKFAFLIESTKTIFVSPAIFSLIETDPELIRKHLKILRMPIKAGTKPNTSENKFDSLQSWLWDLISKDDSGLYCVPPVKKSEDLGTTK